MSQSARLNVAPWPQPEANLPKQPSPMIYPGGKSRAIPIIVPVIMAGLSKAETTELVSPFFGGGGLELACAHQGITVHGSDIFGPLTCFWRYALSEPLALANAVKKYHSANMSPKTYKELQKLLPKMPDHIEKAAVFFVLNRLSHYGLTLSGPMAKDHRLTPNSIEKLRRFSAPGVTVQCLDFVEALAARPKAFAYLDPPYNFEQKRRNRLYGANGDTHEAFDHDTLFATLAGRDNWIMSYNADQHVLAQFEGFPMAFPIWQYGMAKGGASNEVLIFSKNCADLAEMARSHISALKAADTQKPANDNAQGGTKSPPASANDNVQLVATSLWDTPDLTVLSETTTPSPPFPTYVLGDEWGKWCEKSAAAANAPVDYVAMSLMTAAAGLVGNSLTVRANNGFVQASPLWMCCVGKSGSGKTPALNTISDIVDALEGQGTDRQRLRQVSVAGAAKLASVTPKGLILFRDELSGLWTSLKRNEGEDFWLEAYNGKPFTKDRENRDTVHIDKLAISVIGGAQPGTIKDVTTDKKSRGFSARYIFGYPDPVNNYEGTDVEIDTTWATSALGRLKNLPVAAASIPLSEDGLVIFRNWWNGKVKEVEDYDGLWAEWLLKQGGNALRIALCLEMLRWSTVGQSDLPNQVPTSTLRDAITFIDAWAIPMAQRTLEVMHRPSADQHAAALARILRRAKLLNFNARRVRRGECGPVGSLGDAKAMETACQALVSANLIRHVGVRNHSRRGRTSQDYEVNSALFA